MNKEEPFRDQAERLRQKIERVNKNSETKINLPSRSDVHRNKKNKTKWKVKYPVIRILVLFFTLLPITIFSVYSYLGDNKPGKSEKASSEQNGYEEINFESNDKEEDLVSDSEATKMDDEVIIEDKVDKVNEQTNQSTNKVDGESTLPSTDKDQTQNEDQGKSDPTSETMIYHTVQSNETLFRIAMKYYNSQNGIDIIKKANGIMGNEIQAGQVLKIPK
ncbi:LysM peptidoglycan-binding domain-containing protein [Neobacillus sp. D3-1R]|uniref:LysM peptidoglycan-binding domain-containing protein n=1 Tax=Neobacillus sp. D3-1R TaxID=3445778 RepID=UPI003F9F4F27